MIARTDEFKEEIKKLGKQIDFKILVYPNYNIATEDGKLLITENNIQLITEQIDEAGTTEAIQSEDIYNVSVVRKGNLLSTMMKEIDFDIKQEIKVGDIIDCSFGLKVNDNYEWIDYGRYIIYSKEFNEDTKTYSYVAYDSMLLTMKDVDDVSLIQGVTVKTAIENICEKVGLDVNITADDVTNYPNLSNIINEDAFNNIEMTYRDVLDMICQALGLSMISDNKTLYLKDINKGNLETHEVEEININLEDIENGKIKEFLLKGNTEQSGTPSPTTPQDVETVTGYNKIDVVGKNLFNQNNVINNANINSSGEIVSDNYNIYYVNVESNKTYTMSIGIGRQWVYSFYENIPQMSSSGTSRIVNTSISETFTVPENYNYIAIRGISDTTEQIANLQLEEGSTATEYEPYQEQSYEINLGKNLLNTFYQHVSGDELTSGGVKYTFNNDGSITIEGTASSTSYILLYGTSLGKYNEQRFIINDDYVASGIVDTNIRLASRGTDGNYYDILHGTVKNIKNIPISSIYIQVTTGTTVNETIYLQIEKGFKQTSYSPYKTPIEFCSIGDYTDEIRKSTGKNLFDKDNANYVDTSYIAGNNTIANTNSVRTYYISCKKKTTYTISKIVSNFFIVCTTSDLPALNTTLTQARISDATKTNITITTGVNDNYLVFNIYQGTDTTTLSQILNSIQIEENSTATDLEPYGTGIWYKYAEIGKVVLDGSQDITRMGTNTTGKYRFLTIINNFDNSAYRVLASLICNRLSVILSDNVYRCNQGIAGDESTNLHRIGMYIEDTSAMTVAEFQTWLSTHNIEIYYPLATPTVEIITNEELIEQLNTLENINLYNGINNITTITSNMLPYIKIKYNTGYGIEEFDAEYLKNINVKFGEKYMINSVVLSRSEDTDTINRRDEESIALNGVHEFKIKDNLILNFNDREDYIDEIFNQLNGLEYYINDFTSTGITYLEPLDMYNVSIDDNSYQCLLLNDEIKINQGLEENIYTEQPQETTTDYKTSGKTDKEVSFIVDKQNANINAKVSKGEVINEINLDESGVSINAEKINLNGVVTANNNFKILSDGSMEAKNGSFNGSINLIDDGTSQGSNLYIESSSGNASIFSTGMGFSCGNLRFMLQMIENPYNPYVIIIENISNGKSAFINAGSIVIDDIYAQNLYVDGTKNRVVDIGNKKVLMNAYETATPYFGDIGSNKTNKDGYCKIEIEEIFSKTIELDDYKVFIQECGEGNLYVEKHDGYFEVKGTPNLDFDWEIKAIQKGYKDTRLDEFINKNERE